MTWSFREQKTISQAQCKWSKISRIPKTRKTVTKGKGRSGGKERGANQSERDEAVNAMPCRVFRVSRSQSSWPKGPKKSGRGSSGVASRRSEKAPSQEERVKVKKEGSTEKVIPFPETAVSFIYRTQKSKEDKRKKKSRSQPHMLCNVKKGR